MSAADHEMHTLAGAYAMDAVSAAERREFEQHLQRCPECWEEVGGFRAATARLAVAAAVRPRAELRDQVTRAARSQRQHRPAVRTGRRSRRQSFLLPVATAAGVAACTAAVVIGVAAHGANQQLTAARHGSAMIADVLTAPDAVMLTAKVSTGGTATVLMSRREHAAVFTARGLAALPAARRYELWLMGPGGAHPAGMLPVPGGMAGPAVLAGLQPGEMVGLTIEPASGSARPTSSTLVLLGSRRG